MYRIPKLIRKVLDETLGGRGVVLLFCGLAWTAMGTFIFLVPNRRFSASANGPLAWFDIPTMGAMWIVCGVFAIALSIIRSTAWPPFRRFHLDSWGFNALCTPSTVFMCLYGWSALTYGATGGEYGNRNSLFGFLVWGSVTLILVVANAKLRD